jgi:hypothetical protein
MESRTVELKKMLIGDRFISNDPKHCNLFINNIHAYFHHAAYDYFVVPHIVQGTKYPPCRPHLDRNKE